MATKKPKKTSDHFIKALNPRDADTKYLGDEPYFPLQPEAQYRGVALARGFTWYGRFYGKKDAKELLAQYCDHHDRENEAKILRKVEEKEFMMTLCWLARMTMRGLELSEHESTTLENEISRLTKLVAKPQVVEKEVEKVSNRPNIQEIMRDKAKEAAGELEGLFDDLITTGKAGNKVVDIVAKFNVMPQHIPLIVEIWKRKQTEFDELTKGEDKDLKEAYAYLGKIQVRNIIKYIEQVLTDLNSYISIKKASKAPRKHKAVPVEKIVAKLKYLKEFKDLVNKLDLVSIHPTKLHGASEAWVYDTSKRKLHHYIADEYSKTFTVKGTSLLGFDANKSEIKTLRKPGEQIKEVMGSKPAARKFFDSIKAVAAKPNGRFSEHMIILKAF
jgi:hypothetical protein